MKTAIIIPARYGSTRFPGKPLAMIGGQTMLSRVVEIAKNAAKDVQHITIAVATEDQRIADHCKNIGADCIVTSDQCPTGSDRTLEALQKLGNDFDFVFSLQGDAPFTPVEALQKMHKAVEQNPDIQVVTPVVQMRWKELDNLRANKQITPFTGTTCVIDRESRALWFSKNIIPAMRKEMDLRQNEEFSPVYQHIGLYGYRPEALQKFVNWPQGDYETLEGLEQLRFLENGIAIHAVKLSVQLGAMQAGIDSPEDITRAEAYLKSLA